MRSKESDLLFPIAPFQDVIHDGLQIAVNQLLGQPPKKLGIALFTVCGWEAGGWLDLSKGKADVWHCDT